MIAAVRAANDAADYALLERRANELLEHSQLARDRAGAAVAYRYLGNARLGFRDVQGAERAYKTALQIFEDIGDTVGAAVSRLALGNLELELRLDLPEARYLVESALPTIRAFGSAQHLATALGNLGEIARLEGDYDRSMMYAGEALDIFEDLGDRTRAAVELLNIAHCRMLKRDLHSAVAVLGVAYESLIVDMNPRWLARYVDLAFMLAVQVGAWEDAALLLGCVEQYSHEKNVPRLLNHMPWFSKAVERLAETVHEDRLAQLRAQGAALTMDGARAVLAEVASKI